MCLYQKFSLPSQKVNRRKPFLQNDNDEKLFKKEYEKILPAVYPIINKKFIYISMWKVSEWFEVKYFSV